MTTQPNAELATRYTGEAMHPGLRSPLHWLRAGWSDFTAAPGLSAAVGVGFTLLCAAALAAVNAMPTLLAAVLVAMLLTGPYLAATVYFISSLRARGVDPTPGRVLALLRERALAIGLFAGLCALIVAAWVRLTSVAFAAYYGSVGAGTGETARAWIVGLESPAMLIFAAGAGLLLAGLLFSVSAISLPMIADRNCNMINAMDSSLKALRANLRVMLVWLALITGLLTVALFSGLLLMPVVFPLLAYATWHSYRQLSAVHYKN